MSRHLLDAPFARGCGRSERQAIRSLGTTVPVPAGAVLTAEGRANRQFGVLLTGHVEVRRAGELVAELGPGDHFGEVSLLGAVPHHANATVTAVEPVALEVLSAGEFALLLSGSATVRERILRTALRRTAPPPVLYGA